MIINSCISIVDHNWLYNKGRETMERDIIVIVIYTA